MSGLCRNAGKYEQLWDLKELMRQIVKDGGLARPGASVYVSLIRVSVMLIEEFYVFCFSSLLFCQENTKQKTRKTLFLPPLKSGTLCIPFPNFFVIGKIRKLNI